MTIDALRFALAATAVLIVTRNRLLGAAVAVTFAISIASLVALRNGLAGQATQTFSICLTIALISPWP